MLMKICRFGGTDHNQGEYIQPIWGQSPLMSEPGPGNYYIFIHIICI